MTMTDLLIKVLERRYNHLLSDYAFNLDAGSPEQDDVAEEMESIDFELFQLHTDPDIILSPTQDNNWGQDALDAIGHASDDFFPMGCGGPPTKWVN